MAVTKRSSGTKKFGSSASKESSVDVDDVSLKYNKGVAATEQLAQNWLLNPKPDSDNSYRLGFYLVTAIAFAVRFYKIYYPREVVFDEVHFGKFASYYLERTFFFDVHPPLAKMMIAFIGWLCNYDGSFKFEEIGLSYDKHPAPFLAYRSFNALLGTLTVSIMFESMKELNFKAITCFLASMLVAIDNAHVTETRLILLDAILLISVAATVYSYIRFYKLQLKEPFSWNWYIWLYLTGFSLSCVISTKYIGVMTYAAIGIPVVVNLWQLLDINAKLSIRMLIKHIGRRLNGLILIPFIIYLFWFYVHFAILNVSGPGDVFMSSEFQDTLHDSEATKLSKEVQFFDIVTFENQDTGAFLHSHLARYPLRYEDDRVSSQGQQVTCYTHEDVNNQWEILPVADKAKGDNIRFGDEFRLRHVGTDSYLLAHDVASPLYPTNEEITTVHKDDALGARANSTIFRFQPINKKDEGHIIKSKNAVLRIIHKETVVALWSHNDELLPDWGFGQQEVNGNKKMTDSGNAWTIDSIVNLDEKRSAYAPKEIKSMPFFNKWLELQKLMFEQNNKLTSEHPFASQPESWPGSMSGVSFWTKNEERRQIYFIGNIIGFWFQVISFAVYVGIIIADQITRQRGYFALNKVTREKLYGPLAYLFCGWACHYFPFFLMGRQKFLHHYLPAHLIAALFAAGLWETVFSRCKSDDPYKDEEKPGVSFEKYPAIYTAAYITFNITVLAALVWCFAFFSPLIYATPLSAREVIKRKWLDISLSFAK
ncbi:Dolichyl-phosphate-mannose--protein mannosyltransferase 4 [Nakaseomyces glabratus]|nr:Dolichyl-phosphate-mannose--protein mannosyltransferase 4 [Nakaseomyces glabratus]KTB23615.1 Dolichyl-phosphate-mannose--protein mannosyltransferase 4 [Nakaseomyces glabratus]